MGRSKLKRRIKYEQAMEIWTERKESIDLLIKRKGLMDIKV